MNPSVTHRAGRAARRWFTLPPGLVLVLALVAAANLTKLSSVHFGPDRPVDFRPAYVGQWALRHGLDPYQDRDIRESWRRIVADENLVSHSTPGLPDQAFIYPPWAAAWLGILLGALPYSLAWPLWYGVVLLALLAACYATQRALARLNAPPLTTADLLLTALALKATVVALINGQNTFMALALATGAWWAAGAGRRTLAGVLLGLAAFKITVALPFIGLFLLEKRWRSIVLGGAVGAVMLALFWFWAADPASSLASYRHLLDFVQADVVRPTQPGYPLGRGMILQFELRNLLEFLRPGGHRWAGLAGLGLAGLVLVRLWGLRRAGHSLDGLYALLLLHLLGLLFTYHVVYDALLLLPLLAYGRAFPGRVQAGLLALTVPFFLPINGLLDRLGQPMALHLLYFTLPLATLGLLLYLLVLGPRPLGPVRA
ncbi:hypothetical protein GCM10028824_24040 [Hymenobacter segetis]|uniref:Glycosyltransferase family 87 protein n=1 Tax=Hymenobacter segetis TaxID=2025509 RepID=A0ABU9LXC4_9BACT